MTKSNEPTTEAKLPALWQLAFRAGFLLAAAFAVLGMARWLYWMIKPESWDFTLLPPWWHAHEMLFGFAMPVVAGFLLTAVATWTGIPGTRGWRLKLLFGLWLTARIILWLFPQFLFYAWLAEILFFALLLYELTVRVWAVRQWRNMLFPPVLLALALLSTASYRSAADPALSMQLHYGAVWMITTLVVIIGGRVIPLFTGNRLGLKIAPLPIWFDSLAIGSTALIGLLTATLPSPQTGLWFSLLCLGAGAIHLLRMAHWQGWKTFREPLLWSMHLSYLCIPLGLFSLAVLGNDTAAARNIIHLLAIGTVGGMILAMMSRVSLGHTGRPLKVPAYIALAFGLVLAAAVVRALLPELDARLTFWSWRLAAGFWLVAFTLFLLRYIPVLTQPRADGKAG